MTIYKCFKTNIFGRFVSFLDFLNYLSHRINYGILTAPVAHLRVYFRIRHKFAFLLKYVSFSLHNSRSVYFPLASVWNIDIYRVSRHVFALLDCAHFSPKN